MGANIYAAALLHNSPLFTRINKSTEEEEEEEAAYRPLLRSFDSICGGSHALAYSSEVLKKHARAARLSYHHPCERGWDGSRRREVSGAPETAWLPCCPWRQHMGEECVAGETLQS